MRLPLNKQNLLSTAMLGLLLALALPGAALGGQHGKSGNSDEDKRARKCAKFVNCHDASAGRRDGKGPRSERLKRLQRRNRINERRDAARLRNRTDRRSVREVNRNNTVKFRKARG